MSEKLKPCPFCGCYGEFFTTDGTEVGVYWYWVKCWACDSNTGLHETEEKAAAAWNQRTGDE